MISSPGFLFLGHFSATLRFVVLLGNSSEVNFFIIPIAFLNSASECALIFFAASFAALSPVFLSSDGFDLIGDVGDIDVVDFFDLVDLAELGCFFCGCCSVLDFLF